MGRRLVGPALLLAVCACTAVLDFDPVGLPCETDEHCPSPTRCGPDGECVGGAADGGGAAPPPPPGGRGGGAGPGPAAPGR